MLQGDESPEDSEEEWALLRQHWLREELLRRRAKLLRSVGLADEAAACHEERLRILHAIFPCWTRHAAAAYQEWRVDNGWPRIRGQRELLTRLAGVELSAVLRRKPCLGLCGPVL